MNLTKEENQVLTLLDDVPVKFFEDYAQKFVNLTKEKIKIIISKFMALEMIEVTEIPEKGPYYFQRRDKITSEMLDDDLRFKIDSGGFA